MDYFKRLRNAGLIEILDDPKENPDLDLFWACMNGGQVKLTPIGLHYWDLAFESPSGSRTK